MLLGLRSLFEGTPAPPPPPPSDTGGGGILLDLGKRAKRLPRGLERIQSQQLSPRFGLPDYEIRKLERLKARAAIEFRDQDELALIMILSELD